MLFNITRSEMKTMIITDFTITQLAICKMDSVAFALGIIILFNTLCKLILFDFQEVYGLVSGVNNLTVLHRLPRTL